MNPERLDSILGGASESNNGHANRLDSYLEDRCPTLAQLMGCSTHKGKPRLTHTLILFQEGSASKVTIRDRQRGLVGFLTVDSFDDVLEVVERALEEGKVDWRPERASQPRR